MDYGDLLCKAQENNRNATNKEVRCYKTSFSPPKKLERTVSSVNIQKFLARREEEEKRKKEEARQRKEALLALRSQDKKATRRVQTMLRSTKSANKSVMEDAVDNVNTRDTINGFKQCDEDDYGYVSQEASAFYNKLLNKYENMPPEPPKFEPAKREVKDLKAAKDRVRAALQKEAEEELLPHKRKKRKHKDNDENDDIEDSKEESTPVEPEVVEEKKSKPKPKKPMPPPMNFDQLLKVAEKKQFEPIMIDESLLKKEPERLMTKKQKLEAEKMASCKKSKQARMGENPSSTTKETSKEDLSLKKIPKIPKTDSPKPKKPDDGVKADSKIEKKQASASSQSTKDKVLENKEAVAMLKKDSSIWSKSSGSSNDLKIKNNVQPNKIPTPLSRPTPKVEKKVAFSESKTDSSTKAPKNTAPKVSDLELEIQKMKAKQAMLLRQLKEKELAMKRMEEKKKKEAIVNKQMKCEPERKIVKKPLPPPPKKKVVPSINKRRIDSESEEYDSELDDFIDDGPDEENDYSKYISEIFGYDKSRYANVEDEDDECMESNFAQISKEEYVSTKIGIMEDLEDIRKEQEEKKRLKERKLKKLAEARKNKKL